MFTGKEGNKLKIEEIRLSPELLRINSRYAGGGGLAKILLILIVALPLLFYKDIINVIQKKSPDEQLVLVSMALIFLAAFFFTLYRMNRDSGKSLIMTEKGFFIEPGLAEFWKDIDEYRWNASAETALTSDQNEGTSLFLFNHKGVLPKNYDLVQYGIFFTPDQVQQADAICQRFGIKKLES